VTAHQVAYAYAILHQQLPDQILHPPLGMSYKLCDVAVDIFGLGQERMLSVEDS
jgi:hypothetical protein